MFSRAKAFTLIELLMVIAMIGILSTMFGLSFVKLVADARFKNAKTEIVSMVEKARSLALSNILINDDVTTPTDYYKLTLSGTSVSVDAYADDDVTTENIDTFTLNNGITFAGVIEAYYFTPYGLVCFDTPDCDSANTDTYRFVTMSDSNGNTATFTIDVNGGYVNVD